MPDSPAIAPALRDLAAQLAEPRPMRRGSLSERYVRCSKAGCACAHRADARHGPYYSVTRAIDGRTRSRWLSAEQAEIVRRQIEAAHQFRKQIKVFWEACEQWADAQLEAPKAAAEKAAKKRGSKRRSGPKSPAKSKPS